MLVLGIETATPQLGLALVRDGRVLGELMLAEGLRHCERLVIGLDGLLGEVGEETTDLDGVAVSAGPGSFTGLRIGIAAAQGLATAHGLAVVAVPTLTALAAGVTAWRGPLVACLDARRGEVYFCACEAGDDGLERRTADLVAAPDRVPELVPFASGDRVLVVGDIVATVAAGLTAAGYRAFCPAGAERFPRAAQIAMLGAVELAEGRGVAPDAIEPNYLRRSDAELIQQSTTLTGRA